MSEERYEIKGKIGQGGVGSVYQAYDTQLNREVAIKRVLAEGGFEDQEEATKQLLKEATALSSVQHPHIVTIYDAGIDDDGPYVVMELINGRTLDEMVEEGILTWDDLREVVHQTLEALIAAQDLDLVHRDLKPSNLMVTWLPSGKFQVKIVDFGLAKFSASPSLQTIDHGDAVFGSIFFMAPEQFERTPLDKRTDMYAMGCLYYYALTGEHPFSGEHAAEVMVSHLQHHVTPLIELRPDIPQWGSDWIMWHIERYMDQRPKDAREALERFLMLDKQSTQPVAISTTQTNAPDAASSKPKFIFPGADASTAQSQASTPAIPTAKLATSATPLSPEVISETPSKPATKLLTKPTPLRPPSAKETPAAEETPAAPEPPVTEETPAAKLLTPSAPLKPAATEEAPAAKLLTPSAPLKPAATEETPAAPEPPATEEAPAAKLLTPSTPLKPPATEETPAAKLLTPSAPLKPAADTTPPESPEKPVQLSSPDTAQPISLQTPTASQKQIAAESNPAPDPQPTPILPAATPPSTVQLSPVKATPTTAQSAATPLQANTTKLAGTNPTAQPIPTQPHPDPAGTTESAKKTMPTGAKWALISMLVVVIATTAIVGTAYMGERKQVQMINDVMVSAKALNDEGKLEQAGIELTEEELKGTLSRATSMDENKQQAILLMTLRHAKASGGYDADGIILDHVIKTACPPSIRAGLFNDVIKYRGKPDNIAALIEFAKDSTEEDAAAAAINAARYTAIDQQADRYVKDILNLINDTESSKIRGAAEKAALTIISQSDKKADFGAALYDFYKSAKNDDIKFTMLRLLGTTGEDFAQDAIDDALNSNKTTDKSAAIAALARWKNDDQFPVLIKFIKDPANKDLRADAFKAAYGLLGLERERDPDTLRELWTTLAATVQSYGEKMQIINGMAKQKHEWAIELLEPLTKDENDKISDKAERAIEHINKKLSKVEAKNEDE